MQYSQISSMSMGFGGIPGTFPTGIVKGYLEEWYPRFAWTRSIVNDLFNWYKEAVLVEGMAAWVQGGSGNKTETANYIQNKTGIESNVVRAFLVALGTLSKRGDIENKWVAISKPSSQKNVIAKYADKYEKTVKTGMVTAIVVASAAGLYFLSPAIKAIFKKRK